VTDFTLPAAVLLPRTKAVKAWTWVDHAELRSMGEAFDANPVGSVAGLGLIAKAIDDDVQLLYLAGVALDRMELRHYQADALRHTLMVDGKVVREYRVTLTVDGAPLPTP
jgi:hypothetical protein